MRTSRISQETTRLVQSLATNSPTRRSTRSAAKALSGFTYRRIPHVEKDQLDETDEVSGPESIPSEDIEDTFSTVSRKRKRGNESPATTITTTSTTTATNPTWTSPRRNVKAEAEAEGSDTSPNRVKAARKIPARKTTATDGTVNVHPPSNWQEIYSIIQTMRRNNPTAPVDTMGCEDLFCQASPPREQRYHTLTALMLSSQTKDTVTAAAMQRLHTELAPQVAPDKAGKLPASALTIENVLSADPVHLDGLIGKVGFHNNKTKYMKAAAMLLRDEYGSDIPKTVDGLMRLPGVGPKMAYLCMSAAWGVDEGIGVDVHVHRITNLWGWHNSKNPEETRTWLEGWLPKDRWHEINKMLVGLGQTVCLPVGRRCGECDLAGTGLCKSEIRGLVMKRNRMKVETVVKDENDEVKDVLTKDEVATVVKEELAG